MMEFTSEPITSTFLYRPDSMNWDAGVQRVKEAGASRRQIVAPGARDAQLVLHQAGGGGKHHVGGDGADDDHVNLLQIDGVRLHELLDRFDGEIAGRDAFVHQMALANSGAFQDPLVGGFHHLFQVLVGEDARRNVGPQGGDLGADRLRQ